MHSLKKQKAPDLYWSGAFLVGALLVDKSFALESLRLWIKVFVSP
jgi:hypothetical protein